MNCYRRRRGRRLGHGASLAAWLLSVGVVALAATPSFATSSDLLNGHGNFERPVVSGQGKVFASGSSFDGWKVKVARVELVRKESTVMVPPQGHQALLLAYSSNGSAPLTAGEVCRPIATVAGHKYTITFLATVVNQGEAYIVVKVGSSTSRTAQIDPSTTLPAKFQFYSLTVKATKTNAQFCVTATFFNFNGGYPIVDRVAVHDRG